MWSVFERLLGIRVTATRLVEDGHAFIEPCPACKRDTTFCEFELRASFWGHHFRGDSGRAFACKDCGYRLPDPPRSRRRR